MNTYQDYTSSRAGLSMCWWLFFWKDFSSQKIEDFSRFFYIYRSYIYIRDYAKFTKREHLHERKVSYFRKISHLRCIMVIHRALVWPMYYGNTS